MRGIFRQLCVAICVLASLVGAHAAHAQTVDEAATQASPERVALWVEGQFVVDQTKALREAMPDDVEVVDKRGYQKALIEQQHYGEMGGRLWMPESGLKKSMFERIGRANVALDLDLAVIVRSRNDAKGEWEAFIVIMQGAEIVEARGLPFDPKSPQDVDFSGALKPYFRQTPEPIDEPVAPPVAEPSPPKEVPPPPDAPDEPSESSAPSDLPERALFDLVLLFGVGGREVAFVEPMSRNLRPYNAVGIPSLAAGLQLQPFAHEDVGLLSGLGLEVHASRSRTFPSAVEDGDNIDSTWTAIHGGLRFAVPVASSLSLRLHGGIGWVSADFGEAGRLDEALPEAAYLFVRPGVSARLTLEPVRLSLGAGYRMTLSEGPVGERFGDATTVAFDVEGGVDLLVMNWLGMRILAAYTRYQFLADADSANVYQSEGAYDQFFQIASGPFVTF